MLGYWSDGGPSIAPHTEVHMSSYEEYEKGFEEDREGFREWLDEYDDEEECRLSSTFDPLFHLNLTHPCATARGGSILYVNPDFYTVI